MLKVTEKYIYLTVRWERITAITLRLEIETKTIFAFGHIKIVCSYAAAAAKSLQSCPTLRDPMDCSLPSSSVHGIFQAKSTEVRCHCLLRQ